MEEEGKKTPLFQNIGDQTSAEVCGPNGCNIGAHRQKEVKTKDNK